MAQAHPRVCGEKKNRWKIIPKTLGSPPRMRGKVFRPSEAVGLVRITPAYAGKSPQIIRVSLSVRGSPPRMRGKGVNVAVSDALVGITPAYAGKSGIWQTICAWQKDHPRVCGEKYDCSGQKFTNWGSPPRMRGKDTSAKEHGRGVGITPAYAGKSL